MSANSEKYTHLLVEPNHQHGETESNRWAGLLQSLFPVKEPDLVDEHLASMPSGEPPRVQQDSSSHCKTPIDCQAAERTHWACPFYKKDYSLNSSCLRLELKRIVDVRQHIKRHHLSIRCPNCHDLFKSTPERNAHVRLQRCRAKELDISYEVTEGAWDEITMRGQSKERGNNVDEKRWFRIWEILFPGISYPQSPYVGSEFSERLSNSLGSFQNLGHVGRLVMSYPSNQHELVHHAMQRAITEFAKYAERQASGIKPPPSESQATTLAPSMPPKTEGKEVTPTTTDLCDPARVLPFEFSFRGLLNSPVPLPTAEPAFAELVTPEIPRGYKRRRIDSGFGVVGSVTARKCD